MRVQQNQPTHVMAHVSCAGVIDDAGVQRPPGLRLSSVVSVPSLSISASRVEVVVASGNGVVQPNITMQWTNIISPIRFVNLTGITLQVSQATGTVSDSGQQWRHMLGCLWTEAASVTKLPALACAHFG
jgi:hypothetical protein